jgi:hypothetical protein
LAAALGLAGCGLGADGFSCSTDTACGAGRVCITRTCAAVDPGCGTGYRWDSTARVHAGLCVCAQAGSDGTPCMNGYCMSGSCTLGCFIGGSHVDTNRPNPGNPCQWCDPAVSPSSWSSTPEQPCTVGGVTGVCRRGTCGVPDSGH